MVDNNPPLSMFPLSVALVTCGELQSENMKCKIPEINSLSIKLHAVLSSMMKFCAVPPEM